MFTACRTCIGQMMLNVVKIGTILDKNGSWFGAFFGVHEFVFFFRFLPPWVVTADFLSPCVPIFCILVRHFSHCHVLSNRIHMPPYIPFPFHLSWQLPPQHPSPNIPIILPPNTFSPPHLLFFSTLLCLLSSSSSFPPLLSYSHLSLHRPPISVLASLVSPCPAHVTMPLSSVVFHRPPFLRVQPTVICVLKINCNKTKLACRC